ncbi:MAG TPA: response regulator, partial [Aliidiomarina sp.]|nr:response regulator [Aliidiomarina sp.]
LTDHKMPLMDGITLIRNLNELAAYEDIPLVLMTTDDVNTVRERAERVGADHVLAKPLDANNLAQFLYHLRQRDIV